MPPAQTACFTSPRVLEGRPLPCAHQTALRRATVRHHALAKTATLARTAAPSRAEEQGSAGAMSWLPWNRSEPALQSQAGQSSSGMLGPLLRFPPQPSPQQEPAKSKTGTQLILPWARPASAEVVSSGSSIAQKAATAQVLPTRTLSSPIVSCAGGGIFFFWEMGVMKYMMQHFDLSKVQLIGTSAGGLAVTLAECGVNPDRAVRAAYRLSVEADIWDRPNGLVGIWGGLVRQWLEELLPEDAAERCNGRVRLVVTETPSLRLQYIDTFRNKQDVIDANMASVHIPFLLDGKPTCSFRGKQWMDGSLYDFFLGNNSNLLTCDGDAFVVDYFNDDQLQFSRLDFVKLADIEGVMELECAGYAYAERLDLAGGFDYHLGTVRKGAVRRLMEYPVRQLSSVFA